MMKNPMATPETAPNLQHQLDSIRSLIGSLSAELGKLEARVLADDLTGLLRRNAFTDKCASVLANAAGEGKNVGILMVDLDHFKRINDTLGHTGGDAVLIRTAAYLKQFSGATSAVGRFGGEEFIVALTGSEREIDATAELIRRGIESQGVTASIGVAHARVHGFSQSALIEAADAALYTAKDAGRNQVRRAA